MGMKCKNAEYVPPKAVLDLVSWVFAASLCILAMAAAFWVLHASGVF